MTKSSTQEDTIRCPVPGCEKEVVKRGLFMHIWQTDDPEGEGHGPVGEVSDSLDLQDVEVVGTADVQMDYPNTQDIGDAEYFDTYTGHAYKGKRGLMVHLGQVAGEHNIPANVTDRFDADDFPIVETDDDGNILNVVEWGSEDVPPLEPYLPWFENSEIGYIRKKKVREVLEKFKATGQEITPDSLEKELIEK